MVKPVENSNSAYIPKLKEKITTKIRSVFGAGETESATPTKTAAQVRNSDLSSEEVAIELLPALNSNDKDLVTALLDKINEDNASTVYTKYFAHAQAQGEKAGSVYQFRGGRRKETLIQGIINDRALSDEEKIKYVNETLDKLYNHAIKYKDAYNSMKIYKNCPITSDNLEQFQKNRDSHVNSAVKFSHNASVIEDNIRYLYNWHIIKSE